MRCFEMDITIVMVIPGTDMARVITTLVAAIAKVMGATATNQNVYIPGVITEAK